MITADSHTGSAASSSQRPCSALFKAFAAGALASSQGSTTSASSTASVQFGGSSGSKDTAPASSAASSRDQKLETSPVVQQEAERKDEKKNPTSKASAAAKSQASSSAEQTDARFKVLRPLHLNLKLEIGSIYSAVDLRRRCGGNASKLASLEQFLKDRAKLLPVNESTAKAETSAAATKQEENTHEIPQAMPSLVSTEAAENSGTGQDYMAPSAAAASSGVLMKVTDKKRGRPRKTPTVDKTTASADTQSSGAGKSEVAQGAGAAETARKGNPASSLKKAVRSKFMQKVQSKGKGTRGRSQKVPSEVPSGEVLDIVPHQAANGDEACEEMVVDETAQVCLSWLGDPKELPLTSLCSLKSNIGAVGGDAKTNVKCGELVLALAGAHQTISLDAGISTHLKGMLKPSASPIQPEWGLKHHQEEGYRWLMGRSALRMGSILADEMGLGKTRQAIAWLLGVRAALTESTVEPGQPSLATFGNPLSCARAGCGHPGCKPVTWERALIVAPAMLVRGDDSLWMKELDDAQKLWGQRLSVWQWHGERAIDLRSEVHSATSSGPLLERFDVVVVSYESFLLNHEEFCKENWTCVILDEGQKIKNRTAQTAETTKKLSKAPFRLAMTGSPIENSLEDFHSILQFVQPDCAGSVHEFRRRFPLTEQGRTALRKFFPLVALRREAGIAIKMVPKEEVEIPVTMGDVQESVYNRALEQPASACKRIKDAELVCTHPWCYATRSNAEERSHLPEKFLGEAHEQALSDSAKMEELFRILGGLLQARQKVLLFFCRTITSDLVAALIAREFGTRPGIVRGDTPSGERDRLIREFRQEPDMGKPSAQVLLLSVWVGAVGLNLPEARWVMHIERVWNPALEKQATSRCHRITSKHPVKAYCLFTKDSIEEHKRTVLLQKNQLSSQIIEALDGDVDEDGEESAPAVSPDLQALVADLAARKAKAQSLETHFDDDLMNEAAAEGEELDEESDAEEQPTEGGTRRRRDQDLLPSIEKLKPSQMKQPLRGKYGDPCQKEQWDWYIKEGRKEMHPKAASSSTAGLLTKQPVKHAALIHRVSRFSSAPCVVYDPKKRDDWIVEVDLGGATCRLFIPVEQRKLFTGDDGRSLRVAPCREGMLPFPILMPSFSRSAMDAEVGMLDLRGTIVNADGSALEYLQIVAVRPSEVEKYRSSAPFFVVMELPGSHTMDHPQYGAMTTEKLGVGACRHWLIRLADALQMKFAFMMDDSVMAWRGVTLIEDPHPMFGLTPGKKAQFSRVSLGQVLQHFASPEFTANELAKFSALGFARFCPDLFRSKCAYRRQHIYSAFLLNVPKLLEQKVNFDANLFIWEDLDFNVRAHDVCKCFRFAMIKKPYLAGGCTDHIARSANPYVRAGNLSKLTAAQIAEEAGVVVSSGSTETAIVPVPKKGSKRKSTALAIADEADPSDAAELLQRSVFELENDPALQKDGAVCDENGMLNRGYYKRFREAFKDKERSCVDLIAGTFNRRPGMRDGEEWPACLRIWDDSKSQKKRFAWKKDKNGKMVKEETSQWGAGWIADNPFAEKKGGSAWFNVKAWGTWRLCFVLAKLQHTVWVAKGLADGKVLAEHSAASDANAVRRKMRFGLRMKPKKKAAITTPKSKKSRAERGSEQKMLALCDGPRPAQPTILSFFGQEKKVAEQPAAKPQKTIQSFFKPASVKAEGGS